jgi:hypothetical protein
MLRCVCCIARCMLHCMLYVALHVVWCSACCILHVTLLFMAPCALQRLSSGIGRGADEPVGVCGAHERLLLQVDDGRSEEFDAVAPCCCMCKPLLYRIASCVLVATVLLQVTRRVPSHPVHGTSRTLQRLLHTVLSPDASEPNPTCSESVNGTVRIGFIRAPLGVSQLRPAVHATALASVRSDSCVDSPLIRR